MELRQTLALRHLFIGDRHEIARSPVVVLAIDEATFDHPSLRDIPMALWNPQFGRTIAALDEAGAKVIGLDIIPTTTAESIAPGHDRPLIEAIQRTGAAGRLVMARADFDNRALLPHPIFAFLAGPANIRSVNISLDGDGIARRLPLTLQTEQGPVATLVGEMARRAGALPSLLAGGAVHFANFSDAGIVPTYSMGEVLTCIEAGKVAELGADFKDRIVLLGATLDVEDEVGFGSRLRGSRARPPTLGLRGRCPGSKRNETQHASRRLYPGPGRQRSGQGGSADAGPGLGARPHRRPDGDDGSLHGLEVERGQGCSRLPSVAAGLFSLAGLSPADVLLPAGRARYRSSAPSPVCSACRPAHRARSAASPMRWAAISTRRWRACSRANSRSNGSNQEITVWFSDIAASHSENAEPRSWSDTQPAFQSGEASRPRRHHRQIR
jgi:hypothetical protein